MPIVDSSYKLAKGFSHLKLFFVFLAQDRGVLHCTLEELQISVIFLIFNQGRNPDTPAPQLTDHHNILCRFWGGVTDRDDGREQRPRPAYVHCEVRDLPLPLT